MSSGLAPSDSVITACPYSRCVLGTTRPPSACANRCIPSQMPSTGTPEAITYGCNVGAFSSYTDEGPPERMNPLMFR